jgi:CPA1 family monovalent cation:H+ antiporter
MEHTSTVIDLVSVVIILLLVAATVLALCKRFKLPFTVVLVVVGIGLAEGAKLGHSVLSPLIAFHISPDVILFVFLPTLIFESSLHLDARELRRNLMPVLTLAIPGLLISTLIIGTVVSTFTPIDFAAALVLGSILSATDPVAVISLFKQLGAPRRLTILVEGESLFNDATAIVASQILLAIAVAGYFSAQTIVSGVGDFVFVFFGGAVVGWAMAVATGYLLGKVEADPLIEISLTTILAYASFLIAEHALHVSGVMATVAAALTLGGWGRSKISPSVGHYLESFWEYLAYVANALIFLLVGLQIDLIAVAESWPMLIWVIASMLVARAVVVFTLVPMVSRFPGSEAIDRKYQAVMYWGGLRGAIALALVLSLGDFRYTDIFIVLVTGAVLFSLIVPGLTIEKLIKKLGLHHPPLADRMAESEARLSAKRFAVKQLPELQDDAIFPADSTSGLVQDYQSSLDSAETEFQQVWKNELDDAQEYNLLQLKCFSVQKAFYHEMLGKGHLSEKTYRNLVYSLNVEGDSLRYQGKLPRVPPRSHWGRWVRNTWMRLVTKMHVFDTHAESIRSHSTAQDYEYAWAGYQGCIRVLSGIDQLSEQSHTRDSVVEDLRSCFNRWAQGAHKKLNMVAEQFPEFYADCQQRHAARMMLHSQRDFVVGQRRSGDIPNSVASSLLAELDEELRTLRGYNTDQLIIDPSELLRKVPVFHDLPEASIPEVLGCLAQRTVPARQDLIQQGTTDNSLYLIARGEVAVLRSDNGHELEIARLGPGDFVGEVGFVKEQPHNATCRAMTPCAFYEVKRKNVKVLMSACPALLSALEKVLEERNVDVCILKPDS